LSVSKSEASYVPNDDDDDDDTVEIILHIYPKESKSVMTSYDKRN
jgi:hypothetical protein